MANTFDPRTYKSGRPATNRLNTAKGVYGKFQCTWISAQSMGPLSAGTANAEL